MKSYTDLKQSKRLAEILPIESADMEYLCLKETNAIIGSIPFVKDDYEVENSAYDAVYERIPCWSLAALLGVLPEGTRLLKSTNISSVGDTKYHCDCPKCNIDEWFYNSVDACVEMIEKLHKLKML
jgi:hypothetical protein